MTPRAFNRRRRASLLVRLAVLGLALAGLGGTRVARADDASDARRHAQRASSLAASGKCKQAVAELDKALAVLRDPALLFNRGECHRKLGDIDGALEDYKQFLSDLPKAPNRAEVERRIAELSKKKSLSAAKAEDATVDEKPARTPAPAAREGTEKRAAAPVSRPSSPPPPPAAVIEPPAPREVDLTPSPRSGSSTEAAPAGVALATASDTAPAPASDGGGILSKPWFWIGVAVVAVGVGVGTFVLLNHDSTTVPSSALGNYKF